MMVTTDKRSYDHRLLHSTDWKLRGNEKLGLQRLRLLGHAYCARLTQSSRDTHAMPLHAEVTFSAIYGPKHTATEPNLLLRVIQSQQLVALQAPVSKGPSKFHRYGYDTCTKYDAF